MHWHIVCYYYISTDGFFDTRAGVTRRPKYEIVPAEEPVKRNGGNMDNLTHTEYGQAAMPEFA